MKKQFAAIALAVIASAALAGVAQAHYVYTFSGWLYHDVLCNGELKSVPNPDSHPAFVQCTLGGSTAPVVVEVLCENPTNHDVQPGSAAIQTSFTAFGELNASNVDKKKGRAALAVEVLADGALLTFVQNDPGTFCVNHNWHPIAVLIRSFPTQMKTWACTLKDESLCDPANIGITPEWVVASRATATCTLPSQYGFANPPIEDVTAYSCPNPVFEHLL
jgi:hypothetical protein